MLKTRHNNKTINKKQTTTMHNNNNKKIRTNQSPPPHHRVRKQLAQIRPFATTADSKQTEMDSLRLHTKDQPTLPDFDYVVVGGGSGGISSARRAASYGAKVAVIEQGRLGGTCVNQGCIPKKLMWYAATIGEEMQNAESYGFKGLDLDNVTYDWAGMKTKRDAYLHRLNSMYWRNSMRDGIYIFRGKAEFAIDPTTGEPDMKTLVIKASDRTKQDVSDNYIDGFKVEEFKGKEVFVDDAAPVTIKLNTTHTAGSYQGSKVETKLEDKTTALQSEAHFIMTAPGGYPTPLEVPGGEFAIDSDGFFKLHKQPKRCAVTGAGYIAVELAQVMALLGTKVSFVIRRDTVLNNFDKTLKEVLMKELNKQCKMVPHSVISRIVKLSGEEVANKKGAERPFDEEEAKDLAGAENVFAVYTKASNINGGDDKQQDEAEHFIGYFDTVLTAVGRAPATHIMNIPKSLTTRAGHVVVDDIGRIKDENVKNVFTVGDAVGKADLTPVAINVGRRLSNFLFGGKGENPLVFSKPGQDDGAAIPTVVFSHPPIGTTGLSEQEAVKIYGKDKVLIYNAKFTPLYCSLLEEQHKFQAVTKTVTVREFCKYTQQEEDVVVGQHLMFPGADEAMQLGAVAVANRLPYSFLTNTIAIHPTAAEEINTNFNGKRPE